MTTGTSRRVSFNGGPEMVMRARGRHGRLYLSFPPVVS